MMTEIPEHLLRRAAEARRRATGMTETEFREVVAEVGTKDDQRPQYTKPLHAPLIPSPNKPKAGLFVVVLLLLLAVLAILLYFLAYFVLGADDDDMPVCYSAPGIEVRAQDCGEVEIDAGFNSENF
jgi:hypothetical protein